MVMSVLNESLTITDGSKYKYQFHMEPITCFLPGTENLEWGETENMSS